MWRRRIKVRYSTDLAHSACEDYRLWMELLGRGVQIGNVAGEPLVHLYRHSSSISIVSRESQRTGALKIAHEAVCDWLGRDNISIDAIALMRDPALMNDTVVAKIAFELICEIGDRFADCDIIDDDVYRRTGELAVLALQRGDPSLFCRWAKKKSTLLKNLLLQ